MAAAKVERRLAAILAADVVGYSRLMEADEAGTFARLKSLRRELIEPVLREHGGRFVDLKGDGAIVEFTSVSSAVEAAVAIQRAMRDRDPELPEDRRIRYRIGINLGDVIIDGDTIHGDGINVAARIEALCEPGGVWVSRSVHNQVKGKLDLEFAATGLHQVKNISEPIQVYRVQMTPSVSGRVPETSGRGALARRWVVFASLTLLVLVGIAGWVRPWQPAIEAASLERMAFPLPNKPSIAVLPFKNKSGEAEQEYFVDGLTDDLVADLSKFSGLFVIARNSVFELKGRDVKVHEAAERLGVRYVVEGSVRRAGTEVRVNVQLVDATTGGQLWAERYDGSLDDIFAVQDKFVRVIVDALALNLSRDEEEEIGRGQTNDIDAGEAFQRGWERMLRYTPDENVSAVADLHRAIELDSEYGRAHAALGLAYFRCCAWGWSTPAGVTRSQACEMASGYSAEAKPRPSSLAHIAAAQINLYEGRHDLALTDAARAIALDPNDPEAHIVMASVMIRTGRPETGLEFIRTAMRLDPSSPSHYALARGTALFAIGDLDQAARVLEEALARSPGAIDLAPLLAATYAHLGRRQQARDLLLRWRPAAGQEEPTNAPINYPLAYQWSPDGQTQPIA